MAIREREEAERAERDGTTILGRIAGGGAVVGMGLFGVFLAYVLNQVGTGVLLGGLVFGVFFPRAGEVLFRMLTWLLGALSALALVLSVLLGIPGTQATVGLLMFAGATLALATAFGAHADKPVFRRIPTLVLSIVVIVGIARGLSEVIVRYVPA